MLKIGKYKFKGPFISRLYSYPFPSGSTTPDYRQDQQVGNRIPVYFFKPLPTVHPSQSVSQRDELPRSLQEKLHQWLGREIGQELLEDFVLPSQPILDSPGFDLYLLELWLQGRPPGAGSSR